MSRVNSSELDDLPPEWFKFIQVCDVAPGIPDYRQGMIDIARNARLYPGEGCIDFFRHFAEASTSRLLH